MIGLIASTNKKNEKELIVSVYYFHIKWQGVLDSGPLQKILD